MGHFLGSRPRGGCVILGKSHTLSGHQVPQGPRSAFEPEVRSPPKCLQRAGVKGQGAGIGQGQAARAHAHPYPLTGSRLVRSAEGPAGRI